MKTKLQLQELKIHAQLFGHKFSKPATVNCSSCSAPSTCSLRGVYCGDGILHFVGIVKLNCTVYIFTQKCLNDSIHNEVMFRIEGFILNALFI